MLVCRRDKVGAEKTWTTISGDLTAVSVSGAGPATIKGQPQAPAIPDVGTHSSQDNFTHFLAVRSGPAILASHSVLMVCLHLTLAENGAGSSLPMFLSKENDRALSRPTLIRAAS